MKNIIDQVTVLLKSDERLVSQDGELLKNQVQELARKNDKELIRLILSDKGIKQHFFYEVGKNLIFDKEKFIRFISNKHFLPDSYTAYRNKIGLTSRDEFFSESKDIVLAWPYKDCVLEGGMTKEDEKRDEIFYNETLAPDDINCLFDAKVFTNFKRINKKGEHKLESFNRNEKGIIKDNLIIKGNNLLALASLKKEYSGKIKLIYIDPPYNTGGSAETFTYNNSFNHSTWLTFIKNRLTIAKSLLREDGFIAITIDHFELFYLGVLGDEILGRENRIGIVSIVHKPEGRNQEKFFGTSNEFMLVYAKNISQANFNKVILDNELQKRFDKEDEKGKFRLKNFIRLTDGKYSLRANKPHFFYPIYVDEDLKNFSLTKKDNYIEVLPITDKGVERTWKTTKDTFIKLANTGNIVAKKEEVGIVLYEKLREDQVIKTHWIKKEYHAYHFGTKLLEQILGRKDFSFPKSLYAVLDTLKLMTSGDDLILDFFAGSGTTGHATLELNKEDGGERRFILIEQLDEHINICNERIQKVLSKHDSNDSFVYIELAKWNEKWVEKIKKANNSKELINLWEKMKKAAFLSYKVDIKSIDTNVKDFADLKTVDQKMFLIECLDKNQLYINFSEIEDINYGINKDEKTLNKNFYKEK